MNVLGGLTLALIAAIAESVSGLAERRLVRRVGVDATATWTMFVGGLILVPRIDWRAFGSLVWWMVPTLPGWVGIRFILAPVTVSRAPVSAPMFAIAVATFVNPAISPACGAAFYG